MKKMILAATVGLALIAGQAVAQTAAAASVSDRIGAAAGPSSEFDGGPLVGLLAVAAVIGLTYLHDNHDDDSDSD